MSDVNAAVRDIQAALSAVDYPSAFLEAYDQLECLASHRGLETFLVREKATGNLCAAKCYDKTVYPQTPETEILKQLEHPGLPAYAGTYQSAAMTVIVRAYVPGVPLDRYATENELNREQITRLCAALADILIYLHSRTPPVIHRDIKPQNVIVREDGSLALIDFDIARTFKLDSDTDTQFFGTKGYAPPEQYGFTQTDCRADIYSFGVLLRFLLTGSARENPNVRLYRPLQRVIDRCTAFAPKERFASMEAVKKALLAANPRTQLLRWTAMTAGALALCAALALGGVKLYQALTYSPFDDPNLIPAYLTDQERAADAVAYLSQKFDTELFNGGDDVATAGWLREVLIGVYGLDETYVRAINTGMPGESEEFFLPWGWDNGQNLARDVVFYAAVKLYWPEVVQDWSVLKDDTGAYPGVRAALLFDETAGITQGCSRPADLTIDDAAILLANADRIYEATKNAEQ